MAGQSEDKINLSKQLDEARNLLVHVEFDSNSDRSFDTYTKLMDTLTIYGCLLYTSDAADE